ncbi:hypothetical protein Tco_0526390 [Tanacetum coccineum]
MNCSMTMMDADYEVMLQQLQAEEQGEDISGWVNGKEWIVTILRRSWEFRRLGECKVVEPKELDSCDQSLVHDMS